MRDIVVLPLNSVLRYPRCVIRFAKAFGILPPVLVALASPYDALAEFQLVAQAVPILAGQASNAEYILESNGGLCVVGPSSSISYRIVGGFSFPRPAVMTGVAGTQSPLPPPPSTRFTRIVPNPLNLSTELEFQLAGTPAQSISILLEIFDVAGRSVSVLIDEAVQPGYYRVTWNGRDDDGRLVPSGIYFARIKAGSYSKTLRLVVVR